MASVENNNDDSSSSSEEDEDDDDEDDDDDTEIPTAAVVPTTNDAKRKDKEKKDKDKDKLSNAEVAGIAVGAAVALGLAGAAAAAATAAFLHHRRSSTNSSSNSSGTTDTAIPRAPADWRQREAKYVLPSVFFDRCLRDRLADQSGIVALVHNAARSRLTLLELPAPPPTSTHVGRTLELIVVGVGDTVPDGEGSEAAAAAAAATAWPPEHIAALRRLRIGDTIVFEGVFRTREKMELVRLVRTETGAWSRSLQEEGTPTDHQISFERYWHACGRKAQRAQGWNGFSESPVFHRFFKNRRITWSGCIEWNSLPGNKATVRVDTLISGVGEESLADLHDPKRRAPFKRQKGKKIYFTAILKSQAVNYEKLTLDLVELLTPEAYSGHLTKMSQLKSASSSSAETSSKTKWIIGFHEISDVSEIPCFGSGGTILKGYLKGMEVALKKLGKLARLNDLAEEAALMIAIPPHPNVVPFYGVTTEPPTKAKMAVVEWQSHLSLDIFLANSDTLAEDNLHTISHQVLEGLEHLHNAGVLHRNLACRNVFLTRIDPFHVKLGDFGWPSPHLNGDASSSPSTAAAWRWSAPESLRPNSPDFSAKSDVWMFGVFMWECWSYRGDQKASGVPWWESELNDEAFRAKLNSGAMLPNLDDCSAEMFEVMKMCWKTVPEDRPSVGQLKAHMASMLQGAPAEEARQTETEAAEQDNGDSNAAELSSDAAPPPEATTPAVATVMTTSAVARSSSSGSSGETEGEEGEEARAKKESSLSRSTSGDNFLVEKIDRVYAIIETADESGAPNSSSSATPPPEECLPNDLLSSSLSSASGKKDAGEEDRPTNATESDNSAATATVRPPEVDNQQLEEEEDDLEEEVSDRDSGIP